LKSLVYTGTLAKVRTNGYVTIIIFWKLVATHDGFTPLWAANPPWNLKFSSIKPTTNASKARPTFLKEDHRFDFLRLANSLMGT
jgi:hypothetical protein